MVADLLADLADLVLPGSCAGCGATRVPLRRGTCPACAAALDGLRPAPAVPQPPPPGLPACHAAGEYAGPLRAALLEYKERGRHRLAAPLGALLARAVADAAARGGGGPGVPLVLVPVPSTAAAARARRGDHVAALARHAARRLRAAGRPVTLARPLRARPRPDSAGLDAAARAVAAENSLRMVGRGIRNGARARTMGGTLVVVDDIVTTGATLAAAAARLQEADMQVTGAAVVAATRLRGAPVRGTSAPGFLRTRGDGRASAG